MDFWGLAGIGLIGIFVYTNYEEGIKIPTCSDQDIEKYKEKLDNILIESINKVKGAKSGYKTRIDNSRFARTGYQDEDEDEWNTYRAILYSKNIYAIRTDYTGCDSSIQLTVI